MSDYPNETPKRNTFMEKYTRLTKGSSGYLSLQVKAHLYAISS